MGYAQYPYKLTKDTPAYLIKPNAYTNSPRRKAQSVILTKEKKLHKIQNETTILEHSIMNFTKDSPQGYF